MFSKEMEALIQATLEDGKLEDNEKAALVKRAQKEGIDIDELEIYINSILQKRQRELKEKASDARAVYEKAEMEYEQEKSRMLRKCPKCGTLVPNLTNVCPGCGFFIDKSKADETVILLKSILNKYIKEVFCFGPELIWSDNDNITQITQEQYDVNPNFYRIKENKNGTLEVHYNIDEVKFEAELYQDNLAMKSFLKYIREKEFMLFLKYVNEGGLSYKTASDILYILKTDYSDIAYSDIASVQIAELEKKIAELR